MQERSLMLIPSCAVVWRMVTRCIGKLKAPVVKQKSFKLEGIVRRFFQADRKMGPMNCASFIRGKNRAANSDFARKLPCVPGVSKPQCPALNLSIESCDKHLNPPPPKDEICQMDIRNQAM